MANTFIKISTVTVGSGGAANIEFTSIPQTYTDLRMVFSIRSNRAADIDIVYMRFNGATTNYTNRELYGSGSGAGSGTDTNMGISYCPGATATANVFGNGAVYIPNYTSANNKSSSAEVVSENNATQAFQALQANLWSNTAAITTITIIPAIGTLLNQYSTATLYGIKSS